MQQVLKVCVLVLVLAVSACGHKGIYSSGYYSGRADRWPKKIHRVQAGETLYSIAWQYGHDYREIARWNDIQPPYTIYPQQKLAMANSASPDNRKKRRLTGRRHLQQTTPVKNKSSLAAGKSVGKMTGTSQNLVWQWPAKGKLLSRFSARDPGQKGIDIAGHTGQPIYAAQGGYVVYSGGGLRGYGQLIIIKHNETFLSAYAHNHRLRVKEGQKVKKGKHIADMGKTGTERVKLHFEIRRDGIPVNPFKYLPKQ